MCVSSMNKLHQQIGKIGLAIVLFIAIFFRFFHMPSIPPSLNWDEVAFGYNAYSILKTGKDEFGKPFPLYFRSLDDNKMPVNTYLTVGSIAVFGYNDFAVRFPSAFLGALTVLCFYFLVKDLFAVGQNIRHGTMSMGQKDDSAHCSLSSVTCISLLSAALLAILPWHIQFSRFAAEANVGFFFLILGSWLFIAGIKRSPWLLMLSPLCFGLSAYSYLSFQVFTPLLGFMLTLLYLKELIRLKRKYIIGFCVTVGIVGIFFTYNTIFNNVHIRVKGTSVFNTQQAKDIFDHKEQEMFYDATLKINLVRRLFHDNQLFTSADILIRGYLTHFSPTFLFFDYEQKQHHTPFVGLLYLVMLPFIPIGFYFLIRKFKRQEVIFVLAWLLMGPIPASITWDIPHAIRVYSMVVPLVILTSIGIYYSTLFFRKNKVVFPVFIAGIFFLFALSSYYYFHQYMIHLPIERSKDWVYGRKELSEYLEKNKYKYDRIIVSTSLEWPYIFLLYYSRYDPQKYLNQGGTLSGGWGEEGNKYDTYEFHKFRSEDRNLPKVLFVGKPEEFLDKVIPLYRINYLDGTPAIYVVEGDVKT